MSLSAAVIRELVAAGVTGDALVAACERIEAASTPSRSKGAERTARWRERKEQRHSDVTASHTPSPLVPPFPPAPPNPPIIPPTPAELLGAGALETKLREAAGWQNEPHPGLFVTGPIEVLINNGADLERDVLPVIRGRSRNVRKPNGWNYFIGAIQDAVEARRKAATGPPARSANGVNAPPQKSFEELRKELVPGWNPGTKYASSTG